MSRPTPPGPSDPALEPPPDPVELADGIGQVRWAVEYAAPLGYRPLLLDLYTPRAGDAPPRAVVVFLHGGGWQAGSRRVFCPTWRDWRPSPFERLVAAGIAVASVDYRLSAEAVFPAQLHDVKAAVRWLRAHAGELGLEPARMVAWGESAGGHLAALLGLTGGQPDLEGKADTARLSSDVAGVVDWYAPTDLLSMQSQMPANARNNVDAPDSRESLLIGAPVQSRPDLARRASPVTYVHPGAPPFHIAHGAEDRFVPAAQSRQLADALCAVGADVACEIIPGADHMWRGAPAPEGIFEAALDFVRRLTGA